MDPRLPKDKQGNWSTSSRDEEMVRASLKKALRKMPTNDSPETLPINLYAVGPPDVESNSMH